MNSEKKRIQNFCMAKCITLPNSYGKKALRMMKTHILQSWCLFG